MTLEKIIAQIETQILKCEALDNKCFSFRDTSFSKKQIALEKTLVNNLKSFQKITDATERGLEAEKALTLAKKSLQALYYSVNFYATSPFPFSPVADNHNSIWAKLNEGKGTSSYNLIYTLEKSIKSENADMSGIAKSQLI